MADTKLIEYRGVIVVGKTGAGKSTVANALANCNRFKVSSSVVSHTQECDHCEVEKTDTDGQLYRMKIMDTIGLFDTGPETTNHKSILLLKTYLHSHFPDGLNLIVFVLRNGRFTQEEENSFDFIKRSFGKEVSEISALVITNCDMKDEKAQLKIVEDFKANPATKAISDFMQAGIYTVGFPQNDEIPDSLREYYKQSISQDKEVLWSVAKESGKAKLHKQLYSDTFWERCMIF